MVQVPGRTIRRREAWEKEEKVEAWLFPSMTFCAAAAEKGKRPTSR